MVAFSIYVLWDAKRSQNFIKLLFIIPIMMSVFLFPPFVSYFSQMGFGIYRTALILICFIIAVIYVVDQRKRAAKRAQEALAAKNAAKKSKKKK